MKIAVDIGHNTSFDGGAVGILSENTCAMAVGTLLIQKLTSAGHQVVDVLPRGKVTSLGDSLSQRTNKANAFGAEVYVCIHFNADKGTGTMVLYQSDKGKALGEPVLNEVVKAIGTKNLGMQQRPGANGGSLAVLRDSNMPAFLIECLFVDTQSDCDKYNPEKISEGIFKGITGKASTTPAPAPAKVENLMQDIKNFQMALNTCGFTNANGAKLDVDGFVGENTLSAAKKMQAFIDTTIIKKKA